MKPRCPTLVALIFMALGVIRANGANPIEDRLKIDTMWEEWLNQPKLTYTNLEESDLKELHGTWEGSCGIEGSIDQVSITLKNDKKWISNEFNEEDVKQMWILYDGLIFLYVSSSNEGHQMTSCIYKSKGGDLKLIYADCDNHTLNLKKK
ncbi:hypothetical protein IEN85_18705 [Pelagicoccus sp. NFK12]|uniref:Uncharacterized protein n=2 Tax=Pelagicoccus enzymogenes TaxID=2773457 RepID=A0A927FDS4_9BACT|nr:hypothetical protein [Pelagicoccus enzymogenes]MBD5781525.1 hypothetical protein [Pelagicoccus enzymogenes]MBD5781526.1 hypothetical protein [Pelagicoccus enzymogenes]MBD5781533.1 hypothetical protein [Pelagicoccus enzymogenes]MBD5781539.1 hypothetical protein [Pelagicoccus enzymogenes]